MPPNTSDMWAASVTIAGISPIPAIAWLDDFLLVVRDKATAHATKKLFSPLGLCTHPEKCVWHPSETLEFLTLSMERGTSAQERQQDRSDGKLLLKSAQSQRRRVGTRAIHRGPPMRSSSSGPLLIFILNLRPLYEVLQQAPRTRSRGLCIGSRCVSK